MTCKHGETGILCAWCDAEQIRSMKGNNMYILRLISLKGVLLEEQHPSYEEALESARTFVDSDTSVKCCIFPAIEYFTSDN